ncbi:MAG: InlB B-repeat-containing protein, partial [Atopobiaceae bacterium]|nr:InlB B-repeat-containing protein [Atopobiaceae bacterium]
GALPWGLAAGFVLILLSALLSFTPAPPPAPAPEPPAVVPVPEPTPTPPEPPIIIPDVPDDPPGPPFIPDNPPDDPPTPPPNPPETVRYTVTFVNWDGSVLSRREYDEGTAAAAVVRPATPTRPSDGSFTYTFSGWSPDIRAVTGNITYTALYSATPVAPRYTVTFVNWDGAQISSRQYDEGTAVSGIVVPADPTRPSDGSFRYIFYGWTPDLAPVTADATYTAVYLTEELPSYNITFVDWDGSVLLAATPYTEGTLASDIAVPADPTRADTAEYTYTFAGWSPDLAEVTADATYTATYTQAPRTYTAPTIELVHELDYYDGWDDYLVDFTATVALNDVAGASGQLKLRHYNAQTGAWEWTPLSGDASDMLSSNAYVQLYSVKGSERTELVPSDYNALYDIPEDAESIEAAITWRFPWYTDDDGDVMVKIREVMNLSFDYTLPNGEESTVALSDDFYLYNDWFFDRIEEPQADATEKTITFYYTYEVEYGGPLNYDNLYWHPHLYDHATGAELDMTPTITRVVEADGTVGDKIVYSFDTLVPGQQYDFTAEVVYSDYGVDDADHWDNWVSTHHTYSPVGFDVEDGKYTITWKDPDGLIIDTTTVDPGELPTHEDPTFWPTEQYTYTFTGWSPEIVPATENATYTAQRTQALRQYPVTFVDEDGSTVLKDETLYDYGTPASDIVQPATPTKPSDATNDYTFAGWDPELAEVTGDATYTATYTATPRTYTAPTIELVHELGYWEDADEYFAGFASDITLNDVAGATGQVKLMLKDPATGAWEQVEFTDTEFESAIIELYTTQGGTSTELTPGSGPNAAYDIPEDAETLEAVIYKHFELFDDEWNYQPRIREVVKIAFDYTLPDGQTGTVETEEFYLYNDWFFGYGDGWEADVDNKTLTLT